MSDKWRVRHPGIGVLAYDSEAEARVAAGTAGEVLAPDPADLVQPDLRALAAERVMDTMGWEDDRDDPGGGGVPPAACWTMAGDVADAVLADLLPAHRRQVLRWAADTFERMDYALDPQERGLVVDILRAHAVVPLPTGYRYGPLYATLPAELGPAVPQEAPEPVADFLRACAASLDALFAPYVAAMAEITNALAPAAVPGTGDEPPSGWESVAALQQAYDEMAALYQASVRQRAAEPRDPAADAAESATWETMRLLLRKVEGERDEAKRQLMVARTAYLVQADELVTARAGRLRFEARVAEFTRTHGNAAHLVDDLATVRAQRDRATAGLAALTYRLREALDLDGETSAADMVEMLIEQGRELGADRDRMVGVLADWQAELDETDRRFYRMADERDAARSERDRLAETVERVRALAQRWVDTGTTAGAGVLASAVFHALDERGQLPEAGEPGSKWPEHWRASVIERRVITTRWEPVPAQPEEPAGYQCVARGDDCPGHPYGRTAQPCPVPAQPDTQEATDAR